MADFAGRDVMDPLPRSGRTTRWRTTGIWIDDIAFSFPRLLHHGAGAGGGAVRAGGRHRRQQRLPAQRDGRGGADVAQHRRGRDHAHRRAHQPHRSRGADVHHPRRRRAATAPSPWAATRAAPPPATATRWRNTATARPATHWDSTVVETVTPTATTEDVDAARRRQLHRRAAVEPVLPLHRDHPAQERDRRLHADHVLPDRLHHPRADGRLRARLQGAGRLRPARLRGRLRGVRRRSRVQPLLPLDRGAVPPRRRLRLRRRQLLPRPAGHA